MYIFAITGTKGKTTLSRLISQCLLNLQIQNFQVDTQKVRLNGSEVRAITPKYSLDTYGLGLAVCPGRWLYLAGDTNIAVLETSIGCGRRGLGYKSHNVGVFLNVFSDHLSEKNGVNTQEDIAREKSFIFSNVRTGGYAVYNGNDSMVCSQLNKLEASVKTIVFYEEDNEKFFPEYKADITIAYSNGKITITDEKVTKYTVDPKDVEWTFNDTYAPARSNLMALLGALIAHSNGSWNNDIYGSVIKSTMDSDGGRMVLVQDGTRNIEIICDYAHEAVSMASLASFAQERSKGKTIGIVRIAPREDRLIRGVAEAISPYYDKIIVYNKYDGVFHPAKNQIIVDRHSRTASFLADCLKSLGKDVEHVVREDEAVKRAFEIAEPGDEIVHTVHDRYEKSIALVRAQIG